MNAKNISFDSLICSRVRQTLLATHLKIRLLADAPYNIYSQGIKSKIQMHPL